MTDVSNLEDARVVWTEERLAKVEAMWGAGATASQVAAEIGIGVTRNMVCGLVHRRKFVRFGVRQETGVERSEVVKDNSQRAQRMVEKTLKPLLEIVCDPIGLDSLHLSIDQLQDHHCRWPELAGPEQTYCGLQVKRDRPYCPGHSKLAFVPVVPKKRFAMASDPGRGRGGVFGAGRSS